MNIIDHVFPRQSFNFLDQPDPDIAEAAFYLHRRHEKQKGPSVRLLVAVLESALSDLRHPSPMFAARARAWLVGYHTEDRLSCAFICERLGISQQAMIEAQGLDPGEEFPDWVFNDDWIQYPRRCKTEQYPDGPQCLDCGARFKNKVGLNRHRVLKKHWAVA